MTQRIAVAAILFAASLVCTGWAQDQSADPVCVAAPPADYAEPPPRIHTTQVKDAEGNVHFVSSPAKERKLARLIFVGQPALPFSTQDQIANTLRAQDRDDDQDGFEDLQDRVRDAWQQQGYFWAEVKLNGVQVLSEDAESKTVAVTMNVAAGKQYRLDEISFAVAVLNPEHKLPSALAVTRDQRQFSDEEMRAFFPIKQGDIFDTHKIQAGIEGLRKGYTARGFINASVVPSLPYEEAANSISVNLEIEEGRQFRIGKVQVAGFDPPALRTLLTKFEIVPGAVFGSSFDEFIKNLQELLPGQFKFADDLERRIHEDSGTVDLTFNVRPCAVPR